MESTAIRRYDALGMLVGGHRPTADRVTMIFQRSGIRCVRVAHIPAACERLAVAMPQVVVVLDNVRPDERDALADRATAVGALVLHLDPALDEETRDELIAGAAKVAGERRVLREFVRHGETVDDDEWVVLPEFGSSEDDDS